MSAVVVTPFPNLATREELERVAAEHRRRTGRIIETIQFDGCQAPIENGIYEQRHGRWVLSQVLPREPERVALRGRVIVDVECECGRTQAIERSVTFTTCWYCGTVYRFDGRSWAPGTTPPEHYYPSGRLGVPDRETDTPNLSDRTVRRKLSKARAAGLIGRRS